MGFKENNIKTASGGHEALDLSMDQHFDLILMDLCMPDMDGYETTRQIRHFHSS